MCVTDNFSDQSYPRNSAAQIFLDNKLKQIGQSKSKDLRPKTEDPTHEDCRHDETGREQRRDPAN
jgi:hypothetical protein